MNGDFIFYIWVFRDKQLYQNWQIWLVLKFFAVVSFCVFIAMYDF